MARTPPDTREMLRLAMACAAARDLGQAIVHLKTLLRADEQHEIANGMLAGIYADITMPDRATDYFGRVLAINPANALARFQLGLLQLAAGQPEDALATWRPSLRDPEDFTVRFHSALALSQLRRPAEALPLLREAASRMPPDHVLYRPLHDLLETL